MPGICLQVSWSVKARGGMGRGWCCGASGPPHTDKHLRSVSAFNSTPPTSVTWGMGRGSEAQACLLGTVPLAFPRRGGCSVSTSAQLHPDWGPHCGQNRRQEDGHWDTPPHTQLDSPWGQLTVIIGGRGQSPEGCQRPARGALQAARISGPNQQPSPPVLGSLRGPELRRCGWRAS